MRSYSFLLADKNRHQTIAALLGFLSLPSPSRFEKSLRQISCLEYARRLVGQNNPGYERLALRTPTVIFDTFGRNVDIFNRFIGTYFAYSSVYQNLPDYLYLLDPEWELHLTSLNDIFGEANFGKRPRYPSLFPLDNPTLHSTYILRFKNLTRRFCGSNDLAKLGELTPDLIFYNTLWLDKPDLNVLFNYYRRHAK